MDEKKRVGFFDSGVGGLSVLKEALRQIDGSFIYIGDTKRVPYGEKTPEQVEQFTAECIAYISQMGLDSCVIACNTATAYGLERASREFDFPVIGVVEAACEYASSITGNKKVALFATQGTVNSGIYEKTLSSIDENIELKSLGCPELVITIENGHIDDEEVKRVIEKYLDELGDFDYDTIVLGCTHFPLATEVFTKVFGERGRDVNIVDPAKKTIEKLVELRNYKKGSGKSVEFFATGDVEKFKETAHRAVELDNVDATFEKAYVEKE